MGSSCCRRAEQVVPAGEGRASDATDVDDDAEEEEESAAAMNCLKQQKKKALSEKEKLHTNLPDNEKRSNPFLHQARLQRENTLDPEKQTSRLSRLLSMARRLVLDPPPGLEMGWKIALAVILYSLALALVISLLVIALDTRISSSLQAASSSPRHLRVELSACTMQVSVVPGSQIEVDDVTVLRQTIWGEKFKVTMSDTGSCFAIRCSGPASDEGYVTMASLKVGIDAGVAFTSFTFMPGERSSLILEGSGGAAFGANLSLIGAQGVAQLERLQVPSLKATLRDGFLDIRYPSVQAADLDVGAAVVSLRTNESVSTELQLVKSSAAAGAATDIACLSDVSGPPSGNQSSSGDTSFLFGNATGTEPVFRIIRGSGGTLGAVFVSRGVLQADRSVETNTFDTTSGTGFRAEDSFGIWASQRYLGGSQILRLRVLAPGYDDSLGAVQSKVEWIYSLFGDTYVWHPLTIFYVATFGIFSPKVSRTDVILSSVQCTPTVALVTPGDVCYDVYRHLNDTDALGGTHEALGSALPDAMRLDNITSSRIYLVQSESDQSSIFPAIGDDIVTSFRYSGVPGVVSTIIDTSANDVGNFMNSRARAFAVFGIILCIFVPLLGTVVIWRLYISQKSKLLAADGRRLWPVLWQVKQEQITQKVAKQVSRLPATPKSGRGDASDAKATEERKNSIQKFLSGAADFSEQAVAGFLDGVTSVVEMAHQVATFSVTQAEQEVNKKAHRLISNSTNFLTFIECMVFRRVGSMDFYSDGLLYATLLCGVHFLFVQLMVAPTVVFIICSLFNVTDLHAVNYQTVLLQQAWEYQRVPEVLGLSLVLATEVFMLFYTIVEYLCRHVDQVVFRDGRAHKNLMSAYRRDALNIRSHWAFRNTCFSMMLLFSWLSNVFGTCFTLYLLLGACVAPQTVTPVLIGVFCTIFCFYNTAKFLFETTDKIQAQIRSQYSTSVSEAAAMKEALEEMLTELGMNEAQIVLFAVAFTGAFASGIAFILLGSSLFISADSLAPAIVSGVASIGGAYTAIQSGQAPKGWKESLKDFEALDSFTTKLQEVQKLSEDTDKAVQAAQEAAQKAAEGAGAVEEAAKVEFGAPADGEEKPEVAEAEEAGPAEEAPPG